LRATRTFHERIGQRMLASAGADEKNFESVHRSAYS
jgi:hypothetical protein